MKPAADLDVVSPSKKQFSWQEMIPRTYTSGTIVHGDAILSR